MNKGNTDKRKVKPRYGHLPDILGKGAAHRDRSKYRRKQKHGNKDYSEG